MMARSRRDGLPKTLLEVEMQAVFPVSAHPWGDTKDGDDRLVHPGRVEVADGPGKPPPNQGVDGPMRPDGS
jgi:hypothetical protein